MSSLLDRRILSGSASVFALAAVCWITAASVVEAQRAGCPTGNLLAGEKPHSHSLVGAPTRITDSKASFNGDTWNSEVTAVFRNESAYIVYDLGAITRIQALYLQGDNNDEYRVEGSYDGAEFFMLWEAAPARGPGMRERARRNLDANTRYLRLSATAGDGAYSISEFQAFCEMPAVWPPKVERQRATAWWWRKMKTKQKERRKIYIGLFGLIAFVALFLRHRTGRTIWQWAMVAASAGALAFAAARMYDARLAQWFKDWGIWWVGGFVLFWVVAAMVAQRRGKVAGASSSQWWERGAMICLILASAAGWVNFGQYHGVRFVHYWDIFHYYVGSKYFDELGYEHIYDCVQAADYEDHGPLDFKHRKVRDLRTNVLAPVNMDHVRGYVETCRELFGDERWQAFRQDARLFRREMSPSWWKDMIEDHGYNATPVSNMVGSRLSNIGWQKRIPPPELRNVRVELKTKSLPERGATAERFTKDRQAFAARMKKFGMIDMLLYFGAFAMIAWAFGLRACALAMVVWAAGYPWAYFWTGGSFARVPWFFMIAASVSLLKKGYPLLGGIALSWSALLRLFPAAFAGGGVAKLIDRFVRRKKLETPWMTEHHKRFIVGGVLGLVVLAGAGLVSAGPDAYKTFAGNTLKHNATALTNHMGLPTVLSWHPRKVGRYMKDESLEEPWSKWKDARQETLHSRRWLHALLLFGFMALLGVAGRRLEDWAVIAASGLMVIGVFQLTCYYYTFMALLAPIAMMRLRYVVTLILMSIGTQVLPFFIGWYDEQYQVETLIVLAALLYILVDIARGAGDAEIT